MKVNRRVGRLIVPLGFLVAVSLLNGCSKDDTPTEISPIPSVAGKWFGKTVDDWGPQVGFREDFVDAEIIQIGYDVGGTWRLTDLQGNKALFYFKGHISALNVISIEETSSVKEVWTPTSTLVDGLATWTCTLSAGGDSMSCLNILPANERYPIRTRSLAKQ